MDETYYMYMYIADTCMHINMYKVSCMHPPCRSFFDKCLHLWKLFSVDYIQYLYLVVSEIVTPPVCVCACVF